jgi:tripartite-type tricarboxylate transporter receptor subunit TctC
MLRLGAMLAAAVAVLMHSASAQDFPSRRISFLVGYPPGGSTDIVARVVAEKMGARLGTTIVVENVPGASGMLAAQNVARAAKDGYTLLFAASNEVTILPVLKKSITYDTRTAFAPIASIGTVPLVLAVHPGSPVSDVSDLIALAKKEPGKLTYASFGAGTSNHLAGELFKSVTGTNIVHVPYKGGGAAMPDLLAGRVDMCFHAIQVALPYIRSGQLKPLGYTGAERSPLMPTVPAMQEAGLPGFVVGSWVGLLAPAGTPKPIIDKLNAELQKVLEAQDVQQTLQGQGTLPAYKSPEEFAAFIDSEMKRWSQLAASANISVE